MLTKSIPVLAIISFTVLSLGMTPFPTLAITVTEGTKELVGHLADLVGTVIGKIPGPSPEPQPGPSPGPQLGPSPEPQPGTSNPNYPDVEFMMQQMRSYWSQFEVQLNYLPQEEQQYALQYVRNSIDYQLAVYSPYEQQQARNGLAQTMSPALAQALLF
jgi:hypothetical protein